jgi:hypothetical protein
MFFKDKNGEIIHGDFENSEKYKIIFHGYEYKQGKNLFNQFVAATYWENVKTSGYWEKVSTQNNDFSVTTKRELKIFDAVFRNINTEQFVFIRINRSNSRKTEHWYFSEKPSGSVLLEVFKSSSDWKEVSHSCDSAKNDHDLRTSQRWQFKNNAGKSFVISSSSSNRNSNSHNWSYEGDIQDVPDFNCLLNIETQDDFDD